MFCSECGTKVKDGAKFCFNCGSKLKKEPIINDVICVQKNKCLREDTVLQEYVAYMKKKIFEIYLDEGRISPDMFYKKAKYYEMDTREVDVIYNQIVLVIDNINDYIESLCKESYETGLTEEQKKELLNYCKAYEISEELCCRFLEKYYMRNEIFIKRELLQEMITNFAETGKIDLEMPNKFRVINSASPESLFMSYKQSIIEISEKISEEYKKNDENYLYEEQKNNLFSLMVEKGFLLGDLESLILGYEKASGIYNKKIKLREERVYARVNEAFSETYVLFGKTVTFEARYFFADLTSAALSKEVETLIENYDTLDRNSQTICYEIEEIVQEFVDKFTSKVDGIEIFLETRLPEEIHTKVQEGFSNIWERLKEIENSIENITQEEMMEKEMRIERKAARGKWTGGGFGVGGAIKGAMAASAMNAANGLVHSSVNAVGNLISSVDANNQINKNLNNFRKILIDTIFEVNTDVEIGFYTEMYEKYPGIWFPPFYDDCDEERKMRKKFIEMGIEGKKEMAINLLRVNPYNPLNAFTIFVECHKKYPDMWDKETDLSFNKMSDQFEWFENLKKLISEAMDEIKEALNSEEDEFTANNAFAVYKEAMLLLQVVNPQIPEKEIKSINSYIEQIAEKQKYSQLLGELTNMDIYQIFEVGNAYCQNDEYSKARKIFVKGLHNNSIVDSILENFFESRNEKDKAIALLEKFIKNKKNISEIEYKNILYILARVKDETGKTFLIYASERHNDKLISELIENGANVDILYHLLDGKYKDTVKERNNVELCLESKSVFCVFCGEKISRKAKFCNYCGKKINYKK